MLRDELHRVQTVEEDNEKVKQSVKPVLAYIVANTPGFNNTEIENIVFYVESVFYEQFGERLTDVEWQIKKSHVAAPIIQTVLSEWIEENNIKHEVENGNKGFSARTETKYKDMDIDMGLKRFILDETEYDSDSKPYSCLTSEIPTGEPYQKLTLFIDETLNDLQRNNDEIKNQAQKESDKWVVCEAEYTDWLEKHPIYPHKTRFDNYSTFENWNVK